MTVNPTGTSSVRLEYDCSETRSGMIGISRHRILRYGTQLLLEIGKIRLLGCPM